MTKIVTASNFGGIWRVLIQKIGRIYPPVDSRLIRRWYINDCSQIAGLVIWIFAIPRTAHTKVHAQLIVCSCRSPKWNMENQATMMTGLWAAWRNYCKVQRPVWCSTTIPTPHRIHLLLTQCWWPLLQLNVIVYITPPTCDRGSIIPSHCKDGSSSEAKPAGMLIPSCIDVRLTRFV